MNDLDPSTSPHVAAAARRRTVANLLLVTGGRGGLLAAWFAAQTLLARSLGPAAFGLYMLAVNAIRLATGLGGDPVDAAVMASAPLHLRADRQRAVAVVRAAFAVRLSIGAAAVAATAAVPWAASWAVFGTVDHRRLAVLAAAGVLGDLLLRSALGYFQVAESFGRFLAVDAVWQLTRAAAVVGLIAAGGLSTASALAVYVGGPYVAFGLAAALLPRDVTRPGRPGRGPLTALVHHAKWVAVATAAGSVYERLDLFLLARFRGDADVGLYAGAMLLASVPDFIDGFAQTVLAPKVAPAFAAGRFNALNRQYLRWSVPIGVTAGVVAWTLGGWAVDTFLSGRFAAATPVFRLLVSGTLFNLVVTPLSSALVTFVAPRVSAAITAAGLALVAVGGLLVIPRHGAVGAAAVIVAARVLVGGTTAVVAARVASRSGRRSV